MDFFIGFTTGVLISILIFVILAYFRAGIERKTQIIEKVLQNAGPKITGEIFLPKSDATINREEIIKKNQAMGKDTPLESLR